MRGRIPGLTVAPEGVEADLATVKDAVAADPIGAGYSLGQEAIADAMQCSQSDIPVMLCALKLKDNYSLAVVVRRGDMSSRVGRREGARSHRAHQAKAPAEDLARTANGGHSCGAEHA